MVKSAREQTGNNCSIMLDTKGPEIRTGKYPDENFVAKIKENSTINVYTD